MLIVFADWQLQTTVWIALLSTLLLFLAVVCIAKVVRGLLLTNVKLGSWLRSKRMSAVHRYTVRSLEEESRGDIVEAIRLLLAAAAQSNEPVLLLLRAEFLASRIGETVRAAEYRQRAVNSLGTETPTYSRLHAAMQELEFGDLATGVRELTNLLVDEPTCAPALLALVEHYLGLNRWEHALDLMHVLSRLSYVDPATIRQYTSRCYAGLVKDAHAGTYEEVLAAIPKKFRHELEIVLACIESLSKQGKLQEATDLIVREYKRSAEPRYLAKLMTIDCKESYGLEAVNELRSKQPENEDLNAIALQLQEKRSEREIDTSRARNAI